MGSIDILFHIHGYYDHVNPLSYAAQVRVWGEIARFFNIAGYVTECLINIKIVDDRIFR
jgi:hypothetical protein